jgi:hypothetical protein
MTKFLADYNMIDKNFHLDINQVFPISSRAFSLLSRNKNKVELSEHAITLFGAIDMVNALEYHYENFMHIKNSNTRLLQPIINSDFSDLDIEERSKIFKKLTYEAVAYMNRIGQLYYFSKSDFVKSRIPTGVDTILARSLELMPFRMKNTAHRSIDAPRGETEYDQIFQAMSMGNIGGHFLSNGRIYHQIQKEGTCIDFDLEVDNSKISSEFYEVFRQVVEN